MSIWSDAWMAAADLARRMASVGASASLVRDVPGERVELMRQMMGHLRKADPEAFNEVVCEHARHAADSIAEIVAYQAEVEVERANRPVEHDDPTQPIRIIPPPEAKGPIE